MFITVYLFISMMLSLFQVNGNIEVTTVNVPKEVTPGKHFNMVFKVINNSNKDLEAPTIDFKLPKLWKVISKSSIQKIASHKSKLIITTIAVPEYQTYGDYPIQLVVNHQDQVIGQKKFDIKIKKISNLVIDVVNYPAYISDEKSFQCEYKITNRGNFDEDIQIFSNKAKVLGETKLKLPINASVNVNTEQLTPLNILQTTSIINDIIASSENTKERKHIPITVYPNTRKNDNIYHKYPIKTEISNVFINTNSDFISVPLYRVVGAGFVDVAKNNYLGINLQGTHDPENKIGNNNSYNTFRILYKYLNKYINTSFEVGDLSFTTPNLIQGFGIGRGLHFSGTVEDVNAQLFLNFPRFLTDVRLQWAITADYYFTSTKTLGIKSFVRDYIETSHSIINYIFYRQENPNSEFFSSMASNHIGDRVYFSGQLKYTTENSKYNSNTNLSFTQNGFENRNSQNVLLSSSLSYRFNKKIYSFSSFNYSYITLTPLDIAQQHQISPDIQDIQQQILPFSQNYTIGLRYLTKKLSTHSLSLRLRSYVDRSDIKKFDFNERSITYDFNYRHQRLSLINRVTISNTNNKVLDGVDSKEISTDFTTVANYKLQKNIHIGGNIAYSNTNRYTPNLTHYIFYGLNINYNYKSKLSFLLSYKNDIPLELQQNANDFSSLNLNYRVNNNQRFNIQARLESPLEKIDNRDIFFKLSYIYNFRVITATKVDVGKIVGTVKAPTVAAQKGIVVRLNGYTSITDAEGNFKFYNIPVGKYQLMLEDNSLRDGLVTMSKSAHDIEVVKDKTVKDDFYLTKPCIVKGSVTVRASKQIKTTQQNKNKVSHFILKLQNKEDPQDKLLTIVDLSLGSFLFSEVRPGKYTMNIVSKGLKDKYIFKNNLKEIEIIAGETKVVDFIVQEKSKKVIFGKRKFSL